MTQHKNVIIATKVLQDQRTKQQFGMIYISINENTFKKLYSNFTTKSNDVAIISSDGTIVSSNKESIIGSKDINLLNIAKKINRDNLKFKNIKMDNKNYTVIAEYMPIYDFYLVNLVDTKLALVDIYII